MAADKLYFEIQNNFRSTDFHVGRDAVGKIRSEEVISIGLSGFEDGNRFYSVFFDIPDALKLYDDFIEVASKDELRDGDQVDVSYIDQEGEHNIVALEFDEELPEDLSQINEMYLGEFAADYSPGMNGEAAGPNSNLFTFHYKEGSDQVYQNLEEYMADLHPDERISENASDVVSRVRSEMQEFEREITQEFE